MLLCFFSSGIDSPHKRNVLELIVSLKREYLLTPALMSPSTCATTYPMSSSSTPGLIPHPSASKKRKTSCTTPLDIDKIVCSVSSSTGMVKLESKEINTPSWRLVNVGSMEENQGTLIPQALEMKEEIAMKKEEEEDLTDGAFEKRHSSGKAMEKGIFSKLITGNTHVKRTRRESMTSSKRSRSDGGNLVSPSTAGDDSTAASLTCMGQPDPVMLPDLSPWPKRAFSLERRRQA